MLLGFKGRYAVYEKDRLMTIMQETANALVRAGKIRQTELSPHWLANDQPEPPKPRGMPVWAKIMAFSGLGLAVIVYLIMFVAVSTFLNRTFPALQF
jgi:type VI protein secretion system component VasF